MASKLLAIELDKRTGYIDEQLNADPYEALKQYGQAWATVPYHANNWSGEWFSTEMMESHMQNQRYSPYNSSALAEMSMRPTAWRESINPAQPWNHTVEVQINGRWHQIGTISHMLDNQQAATQYLLDNWQARISAERRASMLADGWLERHNYQQQYPFSSIPREEAE